MARRIETTAAPETMAPRFAMAWAALVYLVATLALAYPALAGQFLVWLRSDQYIAGYAFREFAAESLKAGHGFPQWNPYLFGGLPYIAAMHGDIFYPTFLLRMMLPTDQAMTWSFAIHLFLAGLFTFGFLRAYGVGFYGALIGGLAYMLSGPIAGYASPGHDGKLYVSALLPLALWMLVRGVRDGRAWAWGALSVVIGLAVLSPHPQLLQYLLLMSGSFALLLAFGTRDDGTTLPRDVAIKRLGFAMGAVVLGGLIGAIQYLPVREYVPWSPRAGGAGWEHAISYSMPIEELLNTVVPQFSGILNDYWGRNGLHLHSEYVGVAVFILAGAGMFAPFLRRNVRWFWIGALIVSVLWTLGGSTPFYRLIYYIVPGTKYFRAPSTMMYIAMFCMSVFAAFGVQRVLTAAATISRKFFVGWGIALVLLAVVIGTAGVSLADSFGPPQGEIARNNQPAVMLGILRSLAFAAVTLALVFLAAEQRLQTRILAWALLVVVGLDLWTIERKYWIFSPPAKELFAPDAAMQLMMKDTVPGRVLPLAVFNRAMSFDRAFSGDVLMIHRLRSVFGYHGNELGRYQIFELDMQPTERDSQMALVRMLSPEFWRHENVHYLYTTTPDSVMAQLAPQLGLSEPPRKLLGPITNTRGSTVYLYRLPGENPAAWVASGMVKGTDEQALATVLDRRFDPLRAAIVDTAAKVPVMQLNQVPPASNVKATVTRFDPGLINIRLDGGVASGNALVVSENFFPGWRATVDGQTAQVTRANYNLMAVPLMAGARTVELRFVDPAYGSGKVLTLIAIAVALALIAAGIVVDRRARTTVVAA